MHVLIAISNLTIKSYFPLDLNEPPAQTDLKWSSGCLFETLWPVVP